MYNKFQQYLQKELAQIEADGLYKNERIIESPQGAEIMVKGKKCLNFCANNYLGLADNPELVNQDPYGEGWLIKIKPNDVADADDLLDAAAYQATLE